MSTTAATAVLVMLLGILSTTQTHLAKALERQGIETWDLIRARLRRTGEGIEGQLRKPLIYTLGLFLNHTTFIYHLFVVSLGGTTALYTSMYGRGLIALLVYSNRVMKEENSRRELAGAVAILLGTLIIGVEGIFRPPLQMASMELAATLAAVFLLGVSTGAPGPMSWSLPLIVATSPCRWRCRHPCCPATRSIGRPAWDWG